MEHLCHRCNAPVEESVPFCPKCGAPQIRVNVEEGDEPVTAPLDPGTPGGVQPATTPVYPGQGGWSGMPAALDPRRIQWRVALPVAAIVGLVGGGLTILLGRYPFIFLVSMMAVGALTVRLYKNKTGAQIGPGGGAKLGAFAGLFSFVLDAIMIVAMFTMERGLVQDSMRKALEISGKNADPQSLKLMQSMIEQLNTPSGMATFCVIVVLFFFGFTMFFTAVGGMVGAAVFGKNRRQG